MPRMVTTVHDAIALAATCEGQSLAPPVEATVQLEGEVAFGWVIQLPSLRFPVIFDTLSGLVTYHRLDGLRPRYAHLLRFLHSYQRVKTRLLRSV